MKRRGKLTLADEGMIVLRRIPSPPTGLDAVGKEVWGRKCADLKNERRLTSSILETLEAYCNVLSDMARIREVMSKSFGDDRFFRYQRAYNEANKLQILIARELGFTSASVVKVERGPKPQKKRFLD